MRQAAHWRCCRRAGSDWARVGGCTPGDPETAGNPRYPDVSVPLKPALRIAQDELLRGRPGPVPDPAVIVLSAVGGGYTMGAMALE